MNSAFQAGWWTTANQAKHGPSPWYNVPNSQHPYRLAAVTKASNLNRPGHKGGIPTHGQIISPPRTRSTGTIQKKELPKEIPIRHAVFFPWNASFYIHALQLTNLATQLPGASHEMRLKWTTTVETWQNSVVLCGGTEARLFRPSKDRKMLPVLIISITGTPKEGSEDLYAATWCIDPTSGAPLIALAGVRSLLYLYDPTSRQIKTCIRGHGGDITSLTTHPTLPWIIASTSRDRSVRIYDLSVPADAHLHEAHWPTLSSGVIAAQAQNERDLGISRGPDKSLILPSAPTTFGPSFGGTFEDETSNMGRCVIILRGQASGTGGHIISVLGAAFHPRLPIIATCGADHTVKIWRLPRICDPTSDPTNVTLRSLRIEDHPLFTSSTIHNSLVTSIEWLSDDTLVSKSSGDHPPGTAAIWKWLDFPRFFPNDDSWKGVLPRPKPSDYEESRSYKILAKLPIPQSTSENIRLSVHVPAPNSNLPIFVAIPASEYKVHLWNPVMLKTRYPPPPEEYIPVDTDDQDQEDGDPEGTNNLNSTKRRRIYGSPTISEMEVVESQFKELMDGPWDLGQQPGWTLDLLSETEGMTMGPPWIGDLDGESLAFQTVAVSPFGGEWVVAAGMRGFICFWKVAGMHTTHT